MHNLGPYFRCYQDDFLGGLIGLSDKEVAVYVRLIFRMYDEADALRHDLRFYRRLLEINKRGWEAVRESLIAKGKIHVLPDGGLINLTALKNMMQTCLDYRRRKQLNNLDVAIRLYHLSTPFAQSLHQVRAKFELSFENVWPMFEQTDPKNLNEINEASVQPESESQTQTIPSSAQALCPASDEAVWDEDEVSVPALEALLKSAAGAAVDWEHPNIAVLALPLRWLTGANACSLEDIANGVRRVALRRQGSPPIKSWSYFQPAIFEQRDARLSPNPLPVNKTRHDRSQTRTSTARSFAVDQIGERRRDAWRDVLDDYAPNGMA